jgi:fucose permease
MYNQKLVFWAACVGMLLFGMVMISLGTINDFLRVKFALDELSVGSLAALLPLGILAGSLIFGPVVDRYGYKNLLIVCALLILLGIAGMALAISFALIQACFFLIGFGGGAINGGTNALVADISTEAKGARLSLLGVFYGIGALGMPAILRWLTQYFTYEQVITRIALVIILPVIYFAVIRFPEPKQAQGFPLKKSLALLKEPTLLLIGLILFFESGMEGITNNWTTSYLQQGLHFSTQDALFALTVLVIALTVARLILGGLLKKVKAYKVLICCLVLLLAGYLVLLTGNTLTAALIGLILVGAGFAAGFPVILGYVGNLYAELSGTAFSIVFVIALIGNTILNYLVGIIAQHWGIQHYLTVLILSVLLMGLFMAIVLQRIKTKTEI